jgi:hypothetical protein
MGIALEGLQRYQEATDAFAKARLLGYQGDL